MQLDPLSPQEAHEAARPFKWTSQKLLAELPHVSPWWIRDAVQYAFDGELSELSDSIIDMRNHQTAPLPRVYLGLVLFFLGHPIGRSVFLESLRATDPKVRIMALDTLRILKDDDIGYGSKAGKLPASAEEIHSSIRDLLQEPHSKAGAMALDYVLNRSAFEIARSDTAALLAYDDPEVRDKVLRAYLSRGYDDGALDALATQLLDPADPVRDSGNPWWRWSWNNCHSLLNCAQISTDEKVRSKAGLIALQILEEAIHSIDPKRRAELNFIPLIQTICLARVSNAAQTFHIIIRAEHVPINIRAHALWGYFDLEGRKHPDTDAVVTRMIQTSKPKHFETILKELVARGLIGVELLLLATQEPNWSTSALSLLQEIPGHTGQVTLSTITALSTFVSTMTGQDSIPNSLLKNLYQLPRTEEENTTIIGLLHTALDKSSKALERPWLAQDIMHYLILFGDFTLLHSGKLAPWDRTNAQWRSNRWTYSDIGDLLVQADVISPDEFQAKLETKLDYSKPFAHENPLVFLMKEFGNRFLHAAVQDDGYEYEHHKLFEKLAASVRPPLAIEALSQSTDFIMEEMDAKVYDHADAEHKAVDIGNTPVYSTEGTRCLVRFVYEGQVFNFATYPSGTWMDVWSVLHAFNLLMQRLNRNEQAYWLEQAPDWGDDWQTFVCAHKIHFAKINQQLHLPLRTEAT